MQLAQPLRLSILYFGLVFLAGVVLGSVRVPFLQPALGVRYAELLEMPLMVLVIWQAAQFTIWELEGGYGESLAFVTPVLIGALAFLWLVAVELAGTAVLRGGWWNGLSVYLAERDAVAGPVYAGVVLLYALMPWFVWKSQTPEVEGLMWEIDKTAGEQDEYCTR